MAVNEFNFTKASLDAIVAPAPGKRATYHDSKTTGLQIRVTSAGVKTFCLYRRTKGGQPERVTLGRYPEMSIERARIASANLNAAIENGGSPASSQRAKRQEMTLDDLYEAYMERQAAFNRRPDKPKANYRLYLSHLGKRKLSSIKHEEVDRLHKKIGTDRGKVTANTALKLLQVMFNKAINEWRIWSGENPAHGIKKFTEHSRDRFLQSDELPRFFQAVAEEPSPVIRDYILLSLLTGARKANVLSMRWRDVSLERGEWRIPLTKNGTPQTVTLSVEAIEILTERLKSAAREAEFVFPGAGKSGHLADPKKGWTRVLASAGLRDLRIHDLRRTLGSWQAKQGASLSIIGKSLNHKNPQTTAIYARLDLDPVRKSVNSATAAMMEAGRVKKDA